MFGTFARRLSTRMSAAFRLRSGGNRVFEDRPAIVHPSGDIVYAIGDVHGCLDTLKRLEAMIVADAGTAGPGHRLIVLLGDMIDRGPDSAGVIDHVLAPPPAGFERLMLLGNHEAAFLAFFDRPEFSAGWLMQGGLETLISYGVASPSWHTLQDLRQLAVAAHAMIPAEHLELLRGLPLAAVWRDYVLVHAGIRPGIPLERQSRRDLIEIREPFLSTSDPLGATIVHGHTPRGEPHADASRISIDLGCFATGRLCAVRLDGGPPRFLVAE